MKKHLIRLIPTSLIGVSLILTVQLANSNAQNEKQKRSVVKTMWTTTEPISIVAIKTKNKGNLEISKAFEEDDDWLDGFTVTVANNYHKTITAITINMVFRREPGDTRRPIAQELHFGPSPISVEYIRRNPNKVVKPGKTADLRLAPEVYQILKGSFDRAGYPSISRVELVITEVGFDDGCVFDSGRFLLQDPAFPNDPTKKIRVGQSGSLNQKPRSPPSPYSFPDVSFLKTTFTSSQPTKLSLTLRAPKPPEDCEESEPPFRTPAQRNAQ